MEFYHGSSAEPFDRFSLDHALEGDGKVKLLKVEEVDLDKNKQLIEGSQRLVKHHPCP